MLLMPILFFMMTGTMVIEWKERQHEREELNLRRDAASTAMLRDCGLLKFAQTSSMRAQLPLLHRIIEWWDPDEGLFHVGDQTLTIDRDDIYFLTGLSRRGLPVNLRGSSADVGDTVDSLILQYCVPGSKKSSNQLKIADVRDQGLRMILFTITRAAGSLQPHLASRGNVMTGLRCIDGEVFDWVTAVHGSLTEQLSKAKRGRAKQFGYGSLICSFFLQRVPGMRPRVSRAVPGVREPRMAQWTDLMARIGGGIPTNQFSPDFWDWWAEQAPNIDDYAYAGVDFRQDPDLPLPPGAAWGPVGKKKTTLDSHDNFCF